MSTDLYAFTARTRLNPQHQRYLAQSALASDSVVIAGYHTAFAVEPRPGTALSPFPGPDLAESAGHIPVMALVRIEHATQVITANGDGTSTLHWEEGTFGHPSTGISWYLVPAAIDPHGRYVIAEGQWCSGGRQAVLPRSVTTLAPGAPTVVDIHDYDPRSGTPRTSS